MSCTAHHLFLLPQPEVAGPTNIRLASISSDAGLRVHSTLAPKLPGEKGNLGGGKKAQVESMVGGVGIGSFVWKGYGSLDVKATKVAKDGEIGDDDDDDEEGDEDGDDEEIWDDMDEVEDEEDDSSDEEDLAKTKKSKR